MEINVTNFNVDDIVVTEIQPFVNSIYAIETLDADLELLRSYINNIQQQDVWFKKNAGGNQTNNLFVRDHLEFRYLFDKINPIASKIIKSWGIDGDIRFHHFIINIDGGNDYTHSHYHHDAVMSGVFYIDVPEGSGNITFERPDNQECFFKASVMNPYSYLTYSLAPKENMLVLFPSFIKHRVEMHNIHSNKKRISIAFDYSID